jgi:hypothetical protein
MVYGTMNTAITNTTHLPYKQTLSAKEKYKIGRKDTELQIRRQPGAGGSRL